MPVGQETTGPQEEQVAEARSQTWTEVPIQRRDPSVQEHGGSAKSALPGSLPSEPGLPQANMVHRATSAEQRAKKRAHFQGTEDNDIRERPFMCSPLGSIIGPRY